MGYLGVAQHQVHMVVPQICHIIELGDSYKNRGRLRYMYMNSYSYRYIYC